MRRPSLRSQLNQVRLWVRQGRTDAWIAHKLDIPVEDLQQFKREHELDGEHHRAPEPLTAGEPAPELDELEEEPIPGEGEAVVDDEPEEDTEDEEDEEAALRPRRRGRRGGRRRRARKTTSYEATFEHGDEGYGLWLDPAVADDDVYSENWADHREVTVTVEPDAITIRRAERE